MIALDSRMLLLSLVLLALSSCVSPDVIETGFPDTSNDPKAIAAYYRNQAVAMREKAIAQTTAAMRYTELFGPEADLVSGARLLAHYYEQTAQELERAAEAHAQVGRIKQRTPTVR